MRSLFVILFLCSCSTSVDLKELKKEFDATENKAGVNSEHLPVTLREKFEVSDNKADGDEKQKVQSRKSFLPIRPQTISVKALQKNEVDSFPVDYPAHLKNVNEKARMAWAAYKPNHFSGEEIFLKIEYLGINVGKLKLANLGKKIINGKEVWHFKTRFKTASFYSSFYELDDSIETYVSTDQFLSVRYSLIQRENNFDIDDIQLFDRKSLKTFWFYKQIKKKNGARKNKEKTSFIPYYSLDPFSVIFFIQGLPLSKGDLYEIPLINKAEIENLKIHVLGIEKVLIQDDLVQAIKLSAKMTGKKNGEIFFWLSNDQRRTLLKANAKISIGTVNMELVR